MRLKTPKKEVTKITTVRLTKKADAAFRAIMAERASIADESFVLRGLVGRTLLELIKDAHEIFKIKPLDLSQFEFEKDRVQRCLHMTHEQEESISDLKKYTGSVSISVIFNYILESGLKQTTSKITSSR